MAEYDVKYWHGQIKLSLRSMEKFHTAGESVVKKYLDEEASQDEGLGAHKVNMFWANIAILKAALYGNPPKPLATREFQDPEDDVARVAAAIIERLLKTGPNGSGADMHNALEHCVEDRLIPGMGQLWLRYDAKVSEKSPSGVAIKEIQDEDVICEYVFWKDFLYSPVKVWEEVTWVARRVWMTPTALEKRFPKRAARIPLKVPSEDGKSYAVASGDEQNSARRGEVYEIWCKTTRKVHWIAPELDEELDVQDDPLGLRNFFPCPRPLVSNTTTTKFIARSDYTMVQDQYAQLNSLNIRLGYLIEACKAVGVYDKSAEGVQAMFNKGTENKLVPVDNWAMFAEKGGIKGVVDWMPIEAIVAVIEKLREARVDCVQQIYELTGLSDIMRGVTNARETYGAQQLKAQYSSSRLQLYQMQVGSFVAETMDIKASIIARHWQPESILRKSLIMHTPDAPYAQEAIKLIKDSWQLMYRINVSSTQMSIPDYNAEKQMRQEFVTSMGQFVSQITPLVQQAPKAAPFMLKILQWAGASFATSGGVETLFDNYIREVEKQLQGPVPESPEVAKAKAEQEGKVIDIRSKQSLAQFDAAAKERLIQIENMAKEKIQAAELASKERIAKLQADVDLKIAGLKQTEMFSKEAGDLDARERDLEDAKRELELRNKADKMQVETIIESALNDAKALGDAHALKVKETIMKAQSEAIKSEAKEEKKESKGETEKANKMHEELVKSIGQVMEGLKALGGKKSISITLPDGKEASAEVTTQKE